MMKITIEGARNGPKWTTVGELLTQLLTNRDSPSVGDKLFRISRLDERVDYRALGSYQLQFEYIHRDTRCVESVFLEVK